jgi:hypothetical protein
MWLDVDCDVMLWAESESWQHTFLIFMHITNKSVYICVYSTAKCICSVLCHLCHLCFIQRTVHYTAHNIFDIPCQKYLSIPCSRLSPLTIAPLCKISSFYGSDYEERRLPGCWNPVSISLETHYFSATESNRLMLCKISGFHGGGYEECRLLGYKKSVCTSLETHYVSAT